MKYVALHRLKIPCPGQVPSSIRVMPGDIFSLDGNEGIQVEQLLQQGHIKVYEEVKREPKDSRKGR